MALVNCPECGHQNVSDKAERCPNCGYPISVKLSHNRNKKRATKIVIIAAVVIAIITSVVALLFLTKDTSNSNNQIPTQETSTSAYNYDMNGLYGIDATIKWEMSKPDVEALNIATTEDDTSASYVSYDNIKFAEKYIGNLFISFNDDIEPYSIKSLQFEVTGTNTPEEIGATISDDLGTPVHKDNFNNMRISSPKWMWLYGENQYIILERNAFNGKLYIDWEIADNAKIEAAANSITNINSIPEYKESYELLLNRTSYINGSIELAINELGLTEYQIVEGLKLEGISYNYDSVDFIEYAELFGHKGMFKYHCAYPYDDNHPDFIGKIEYIYYEFTDTISESQALDFSTKIADFLGLQSTDDTNAYLPFILRYSVESPNRLSISINDEYYKLNPAYGYDDSVDYIAAYHDCDTAILNIPLDTTKHAISLYSDAAKQCWIEAKDAVTDRLKAPSTASFPNMNDNSVLIIRTGNTYEVTSYVDAENSFGANIREYFVVTISRDGITYRVTDIIFEN